MNKTYQIKSMGPLTGLDKYTYWKHVSCIRLKCIIIVSHTSHT